MPSLLTDADWMEYDKTYTPPTRETLARQADLRERVQEIAREFHAIDMRYCKIGSAVEIMATRRMCAMLKIDRKLREIR